MMTAPNLTIRPQTARRELARRELARRHLVDFGGYMLPSYRPGRHHRLLGQKLEQVEAYIRTGGQEGISRLMVFMPPQNGKSVHCSQLFPAWVIGRLCGMYHESCPIIMTSYASGLATDHSRVVRNMVMSDPYAAIFGGLSSVEEPVQISTDSRSVERWNLAAPNVGGIVAAGVGGGITGKPAKLLIIDDPYKNREEAESQDHREIVRDWWRSSARTRLHPHAAIVMMLTRWYSMDLPGEIIAEMAQNPLADKWEVISLPAIWEPPVVPDGQTFEEYHRQKMLEGIWEELVDPLGRQPGEPLWPEWYNRAWLDNQKVGVGPYDWEALYQQRPYLRSGNLFKRDWFPVVDQVPDPAEIVAQVRYWDKAATPGGGARSAGVLMALLKSNIVIVNHVAKGQWSPYERDQAMLETAAIDAKRPGPQVITWHEQEPGSAGVDSAQATNRLLAAKGHTAHFATVTGDKETRSGPWSSQAQGGGVRLLRGGWNQEYIDEHVAFPKGTFKDQVDASSGGFSKLGMPVGEVGVRWL